MTHVMKPKGKTSVTHAIVIGVGAYKHLLGGKGKILEQNEGMGQLSSPPESARSFTDWLLKEYNNPKKPLASLQLLISDSNTDKFTLPNRTQIKIKRATKSNVKKAIEKWFDYGDENKKNLLTFFFCGHGIAKGPFVTLILEDFGRKPKSPLEHSIDFHDLHMGMEKCKAREQCYFIDACRNVSSTLLEARYRGAPIIHGSYLPSEYGKRHAPIYYSTVVGDAAYGRPGAPSVFTEALLLALRGAGSDDVEGDWRIYTDRLNIGINYIVERTASGEEGLDQVSPVDNLTRFPLHFLNDKPIVPVSIGCNPNKANKMADLSYTSKATTNKVTRPGKQLSEWDVIIKEGDYLFSAEFPPEKYRNKVQDNYIRPPYRRCIIEVRK